MKTNDSNGKPNATKKKLEDSEYQIFATDSTFEQTEEVYQNLFNHLANEVHLWKLIRERDGSIKTWELADANPAALRTWGKQKEEVIGKTTDEIFGKGATEQFLPIVERIFNTGKPHKWVEHFEPTNQYLSMSSIPLGEYFISTGKDITEETTIQKTLEEKADLLNKAERMSNQGSWKWDIKKDEWTFSENWLNIHGFKESGIGKEELMKMAHPDDVPEINQAFARALAEKEPYDIEHRIIRQDTGEIRWAKVLGEVVCSDNGEPEYMIGIGKDITQERLTRERLEESKDLLKRTGEIAKVGGWQLTGDFKKVIQTKTTKDLHELPEDYELTIEESIRFYHPDDRRFVADCVNNAIEHGEAFELEARFKTAKGKHKWVLAKGEPVMVDGKCVRLSGVFQDITKRKRSEIRLAESEEKFKSIFKYSPVAKILVDDEGKYIDVNDKTCELLGYSHEELTSLNMKHVIHGEGKYPGQLNTKLKKKVTNSGEVQLIRKSGEIRTVEYFARKIGSNRYLSTLIDITEKRRNEAAKKIAQQQLFDIAQSVPGIIYQFVFHKDGMITMPYVNERAKDLLGFENEKMKNPEFLFSRIHPDDFDSTMGSILEANRDNADWFKEFRALDKNDKVIWIRGQSTGSADREGNIVHTGVLFDISEQKKAEDALRESQQQLQNIADNLAGVIFKYKLNTDGTDELLYMSKGAHQLYEVAPDEAVENIQLIWDTIHKEDVKKIKPSIEQSAKELTPWKLEHRLQFPDGRIKWVDVRGIPIQNVDGSVVWNSIGLEITKQKKAEKELERINKNLEKLVEERAQKAIKLSKELELYWLAAEHAKSGVWRYDVRSNTLEWDDIMYELYGIDKADFSGAYEAWETSLHPDDIEENVSALQETITEQKDLDILFRVNHRKSGEVRYIRGKGRAETDDNGNTVAVFGTNWDVNKEMQLAEERAAIIKELEIYQAAANNAEVGVWEFDIKAQSTRWDDTLFKIYELDKLDFQDDSVPLEAFMKMVVPEDLENLNKELQITLQTGKPMDLMFRIVSSKSKTIKFIRSKGRVLQNSSGEFVNMYGTNWDVTKEMELAVERQQALEKLKEAQAQLIQSEKMASLGILTAGVAHELNNPLNYIVGGCTAIHNHLNEDEILDKEEIKEYLHWIESGSDRATKIVKSLNLFSRSNEDNTEVCNLHLIIDDCLLMLQNKYKDRITITKDYTGTPAEVTGNNGKLHQAILNLLSNAMDAISEKGEIKIRTEFQKDKLNIVIDDNGCGIPRENIKKVMDPFYTTKPPGVGTGLGLSITHSIIQEHEGTLTITSEVGKGTKVAIELSKEREHAK